MSRATWRTHDRPLKYRAIEPALFAGLQGEDEEDALAERLVARAMATSPAPRRPASDVHSLRGQNVSGGQDPRKIDGEESMAIRQQ